MLQSPLISLSPRESKQSIPATEIIKINVPHEVRDYKLQTEADRPVPSFFTLGNVKLVCVRLSLLSGLDDESGRMFIAIISAWVGVSVERLTEGAATVQVYPAHDPQTATYLFTER